MSDWYYADADRHRQGPLSAEQLALHFHRGLIRLDTLVWREGLTQWQPLQAFGDELALERLPSTAAWPTLPAANGGSVTADSPYAPPVAVLTRQPVRETGMLVVHAGFLKRVAASFLDGLLIGVVVLVLLILGALAMGIGLSSLANDAASGAMAGLVLFGVYVLPIGLQAVYFTWGHASAHQATPGKRAVGIKVVQSNGQRLSTGRSLGRWAAYFFMNLFSCGLTTLVSAILIGTSQRKQGLHDMVADTLVVDTWAFTEHPQRQRQELGTVTVVILGLLGLLMAAYVVGIFVVFAMAVGQA